MRPSARTLFGLACATLISAFPLSAATRVPTCEEQLPKELWWRCVQTQLMSRPASGRANAASPTANALVPDVTSPALSLDATAVAFSSDASNLVPGDTNGVADVFVRDTASNRIVRASVDRSGRQGNGHSYSPALSVDGSKLAFVSAASNLVPGDTNGVADVFFKDLRTGTVRRVSERPDGTQANGASNNPFVSLYGDWVTFDSAAPNLSSGDTNGLSDAFVWTRATGALRRLSVPARLDDAMRERRIGGEGVPHTGSASVSHDGKLIAFHRRIERRAAAENVPNIALDDEVPLAADVFIEAPRTWEPKRWIPVTPPPRGCDERSRTARCGSWRPGRWHGGEDLGNGRGLLRIAMAPWANAARKMLEHPAVTADGRYVAYEAWSAITPADTAKVTDDRTTLARNDLRAACLERSGIPSSHTCVHTDYRSIYLFDWYLEALIPVSTKPVGALPTGDCFDPSPNAYGTVVAFSCDADADNLVAGDTNEATDVFVKDLPGRATARISLSASDEEGFGTSSRPSISYDGAKVAFASTVPTFVGGDANGTSDVFLRDRWKTLGNTPPTIEAIELPGRRVLTAPYRALALDIGESFRFEIRASDPDRTAPGNKPRDAIRFGAMTPLPDGASIDPVTGVFRWTPSPDQTEPGGRFWRIVLWAADARGEIHPATLASMAKGRFDPAGNLQLVTLYVRDPGGTARCDAHTLAPELISGACDPVE